MNVIYLFVFPPLIFMDEEVVLNDRSNMTQEKVFKIDLLKINTQWTDGAAYFIL